MTDKEMNDIFSENFNRYMKDFGYTQTEVAEAIGVTQQAINTWATGKNVPRIDKVSKLASFFGVRITDLTDRHNPNMEETLQEVFDRRPDMRALFSVTKDCTPEQIQQAIKIIEVLKDEKH